MIKLFKIIIFLPIKILKKILITLNNEDFLSEQNLKFKKIGLSRELGLKNLLSVREKFNLEISEMSSEHELIFSALSIEENFKPKNILEIGTHDAQNIKLMSKLFKDSTIETIDLDETNEDFKNFYNRGDKPKLANFIDKRNNILKKLPNVKFFKKNSLELLKDNKMYDLIWIDGAHGYPIITIDIVNSLRITNPKGIILCDDIYLAGLKKMDKMYNSLGGYQTLEELKKSNLINYTLFYKRLQKEELIFPKKRKFIALIKKEF